MDQLSPARPARRTQAERRDESGRSLVEAAIAVVAREGGSAATQRFGSKQGLIEAVIRPLHEQQEAALLAHDIDGLPGLEAVLTFVDVYLRGLSGERGGRAYFMLLSAAVADVTELRVAFADEHSRIEQRLEALVRKGQAEGAIRREIDADAAALMIGSLLFGLSMQLLVDPQLNLDP